ncbi:MAG: hypothetical protein ACREK4_02025, partial [Candidatus Rokuibacteriota bacterium]
MPGTHNKVVRFGPPARNGQGNFSTTCSLGRYRRGSIESGATAGSDLLAELRPVVEELLEADVGQRMLDELL